jgi:hypothetical protein
MSRLQAERFEQALHQAAQGETPDQEWAPLVEVTQQAATLGEAVPPAPHKLMPGRSKFLTEATRLRAGERPQQASSPRLGLAPAWKLATALIIVFVVLGSFIGVSGAAAASLPGEPLYGIKLATEEVRLALTSDRQISAELQISRAERRLEEVAALVQEGKDIDESTAKRVEEHLVYALEAAAQMDDQDAIPALEHLAGSIQEKQQTLTHATEITPVREPKTVEQIMQAMEQVRDQAQYGQLDPEKLRQYLREGLPAQATASPTPTPTQSQPTNTPEPKAPKEPEPTKEPKEPKPEPTGTKPPAQPTPMPTRTKPPGGGDAPQEPPGTEPPPDGPKPTPKPPQPEPPDVTQEPEEPRPTRTPRYPRRTPDPTKEPGGQVPNDPPDGPAPTKPSPPGDEPSPNQPAPGDPVKPSKPVDPGEVIKPNS